MSAFRPLLRSLPFLAAALPLGAQLATQPKLQSRSAPILTIEGRTFRDLNRNGKLDRYEDWRLPSAVRAADLVSQMTLEEKAGAAVHASAAAIGNPMGMGDSYDTAAVGVSIRTRHVNSMITRLSVAPATFATQNNALQAIAEGARLGIPLTISTDPRNHFQVFAGASVAADRILAVARDAGPRRTQ